MHLDVMDVILRKWNRASRNENIESVFKWKYDPGKHSPPRFKEIYLETYWLRQGV